MPKKHNTMWDTFRTETANIVKNPENWMSFLRSACRNYRLPFDAQVMVHAQRPDATAVLEIERWNKLFHRRVNRGAKGIVVFDREHEGSQRLKYYFDISDTSPSYYLESKPVWVWTMENRYEAEVMEGLEAAFGELENKSDLAQRSVMLPKWGFVKFQVR